MTTTLTSKLHYSPKLGRYMRCVARHQCEYGDAHTDVPSLADAGGGELSDQGHSTVKIVSPIVDGVFSVGTENRRQTFREDGTKLSPAEAARWRARVAQQLEADEPKIRVEPTLLPALGWGQLPSKAEPAARHTNPKDFDLAENSSDAGILAQLAQSADWNVRLLVARNPATATDTLEGLALSADKNAHLYRNAAHEELGHRYQDMRDAAELEACARMEADGVLQKRLETMPNYRQLSYMPAKRWNQKTQKAKKTLIQAAMGEAAKLFKLTVRFTGWTANKTATLVLGKDGVKLFKLPRKVAVYRSTREVIGFMVDFFTALAGDPRAQKGVARRLGFGW